MKRRDDSRQTMLPEMQYSLQHEYSSRRNIYKTENKKDLFLSYRDFYPYFLFEKLLLAKEINCNYEI